MTGEVEQQNMEAYNEEPYEEFNAISDVGYTFDDYVPNDRDEYVRRNEQEVNEGYYGEEIGNHQKVKIFDFCMQCQFLLESHSKNSVYCDALCYRK